MKEQGNGTDHLVQVMLSQAVEEISPNPCARRRDGVASGIGEVFLDPLLGQSRDECASEAGDQAEGPQHIYGDDQVAGASRQDIRDGREY